jgi:hypothetical protein
LPLHADERGANRPGLDYSDDSAIHVQQVVSSAMASIQDHFTDAVASPVGQVSMVPVADVPASLSELLVDENSCSFLSLEVCRHRTKLHRSGQVSSR